MSFIQSLFCLILIVYYEYSKSLWITTLFLLFLIFKMKSLKKYIDNKKNSSFKEYKPSIMVILGSGGHTWEMIKILSRLNWENFLPIYIIASSDTHSLNDIINFEKKFSRKFFYERIKRPREHYQDSKSWIVRLRAYYSFFKSFRLIYQHNPDYILTNGPSTCVPIIRCGYILKKLGFINTKLIYVESAARVNNLSESAKLVKNYVDDMFCFWLKLKDTYCELKPLFKSSDKFFVQSNHPKESNANFEKDKSILVTVGTTQFEELKNLALNKDFYELLINNGFSQLYIQIGNNQFENIEKSYKTLKIILFNFKPSESFNHLIKDCNLIISHGGAGTLIQSILFGKKPIAISNDKVKDNHQVELIKELKSNGYIYECQIQNLLNFLKDKISITSFENDIVLDLPILSDDFLDSIGNNKIKSINNNNIKDKKIDIVIPCIYKDIYRLEILLLSINKFVSTDLYNKIYIVIPDEEYESFSKLFQNKNINPKLNLIKESNIFDRNIFLKSYFFKLNQRHGWFKQQILKLAMAYKISSKYYLILDSDCLFIKNFDSSKVFKEKDNYILSYLQEEEIYFHESWWKGSAELLGITKPYFDSLKSGIGVTPQILAVDIVKELCKYIEQRYNSEKWYNVLWAYRLVHFYPNIMIWTEYTLYYLFAKRTGMLNKYHFLKKNCFCDYYKSVWELSDSFDFNLPHSSSPIIIFQSNTNLSHLIPKAILTE